MTQCSAAAIIGGMSKKCLAKIAHLGCHANGNCGGRELGTVVEVVGKVDIGQGPGPTDLQWHNALEFNQSKPARRRAALREEPPRPLLMEATNGTGGEAMEKMWNGS